MYMYYASNTYTCIYLTKCGLQHFRRLIYGLLTMAILARPLMAANNTGKVRNWRVAKSWFVVLLLLVKTFIPQQLSGGSRYCSINNTNELRYLVSSTHRVRRNQQNHTLASLHMHEFDRKQYSLELVCSFLHHRPLHPTDQRTSVVWYSAV